MLENALYLKTGAPIGQPPTGQKAVFVDVDGTLKLMASDGSKASVASPVDAVTATKASATNTIGETLTLDGDNDGEYAIDFDLTVALTGTRSFTLQPNGLATNQSVITTANGGGVLTPTTTATWELVNAVSTTTRIWGQIYVYAKTGAQRKIIATVYTDRPQLNNVAGVWTVTTGNVTTLAIICAAENGIQSGTFRVIKLHRP